MRSSMLLAVMAGVAWGACGYFEKAGLRTLGMPPIAGITVRTAVTLVLLGVLSVPGWRLIAHREAATGLADAGRRRWRRRGRAGDVVLLRAPSAQRPTWAKRSRSPARDRGGIVLVQLGRGGPH